LGHSADGSLSSGSFGSRAARYAALDDQLASKTRFFRAASHTNCVLHELLSGLVWRSLVSQPARRFLAELGGRLELINIRNARRIQDENLTGDLDSYMVRTEQEAVQSQIDALENLSRPVHSSLMLEFDDLLKVGGLPACVLRRCPPAAVYLDVLRQLRNQIGGPLRFARQRDREWIGIGLIRAIRVCADPQAR
jgi:hypothetical protein